MLTGGISAILVILLTAVFSSIVFFIFCKTVCFLHNQQKAKIIDAEFAVIGESPTRLDITV